MIVLQKDNYEYAKDYIYDTKMYNFHDKLDILDDTKTNINEKKTNINENTIVIPIINEEKQEMIKKAGETDNRAFIFYFLMMIISSVISFFVFKNQLF